MKLLEKCKLYKQISDNFLEINNSKFKSKYIESLFYLYKLRTSKYWDNKKYLYLSSCFCDELDLPLLELKIKLISLIKDENENKRTFKKVFEYFEGDIE